jgi:hypothetical protein
MTPVVIESPFAPRKGSGTATHMIYLRWAIRDSLGRGEAPYASYGFYPQALEDWGAAQ